MSMSLLPSEILYFHIFPYLDVRSMFMYGSTCRQNVADVQTHVSKTGRRRLLKWMMDRRLEKEKFFYDHLSLIPHDQLEEHGRVNLFFHLDDMYHKTNFAERVLRFRPPSNLFLLPSSPCLELHRSRKSSFDGAEWTGTHSSFYDECVKEIRMVSEGLCSKLKKKYHLMLK